MATSLAKDTTAKRGDDGKSNIAVESTPLESEKRSSEKSEEEIPHLGQVAEYCFPMSIVVKMDAEKRWQRSYYGTSSKDYYDPYGKSYYDTVEKKQGMLCILQHDDSNWKAGNDKDKTALIEFFKDTLNFQVHESKTKKYSVLKNELFAFQSWQKFYCLVIFISAHGNKEGIITDVGFKASHDITGDFSNKQFKSLAGIPKIFILDNCRGPEREKPVQFLKQDDGEENLTESSDCLVIHAATHGHVGFIDENGSVGLQGVMKALKANWEKDHLEEILIDARREVAAINTKKNKESFRQTLEIQTTLLHRLKLMKC